MAPALQSLSGGTTRCAGGAHPMAQGTLAILRQQERRTTDEEGVSGERESRMTVYGIAIALLLVFPWVLVGIVLVGAVWSAIQRNLEPLQKAWRVRSHGRSVPSSPQGRTREMSMNSPPAGDSSVRHQGPSVRKAA